MTEYSLADQFPIQIPRHWMMMRKSAEKCAKFSSIFEKQKKLTDRDGIVRIPIAPGALTCQLSIVK